MNQHESQIRKDQNSHIFNLKTQKCKIDASVYT